MSEQLHGRSIVLPLLVPILAVLVMGVVAYGAILQQPSGGTTTVYTGAEERTLSITGMGSVPLSPDEARIALGVETRGATAREASERNNEAMQSVVEAVKALGVEEKDLKTRYIAVYPEYRYRNGGEPILIGYRAVNTLEIRLRGEMLEKASDVIDKAIEAGANRVENVVFTMSDELKRSVRAEAIKIAAEDAKSKAEQILGPMGLSITGVKSISINEQGFYPIPMVAMEKAAGAPDRGAPVFPGETEYTVILQVTYLIG